MKVAGMVFPMQSLSFCVGKHSDRKNSREFPRATESDG